MFIITFPFIFLLILTEKKLTKIKPNISVCMCACPHMIPNFVTSFSIRGRPFAGRLSFTCTKLFRVKFFFLNGFETGVGVVFLLKNKRSLLCLSYEWEGF